MSKITTANGSTLDMEALRLQHEKTIAVGNMRVNARGDEISPTTGQVTRKRQDRMTDYYRLHSAVPQSRVATPDSAQATELPESHAEVTESVTERNSQ
jgi:hypothetical protein